MEAHPLPMLDNDESVEPHTRRRKGHLRGTVTTVEMVGTRRLLRMLVCLCMLVVVDDDGGRAGDELI